MGTQKEKGQNMVITNRQPSLNTLNHVHHDYPAGMQTIEIESDKYVFVVVGI